MAVFNQKVHHFRYNTPHSGVSDLCKWKNHPYLSGHFWYLPSLQSSSCLEASANVRACIERERFLTRFSFTLPTVSCQDWDKGTISSWWNWYIFWLTAHHMWHSRNKKCTSLIYHYTTNTDTVVLNLRQQQHLWNTLTYLQKNVIQF